MSIPREPRQKMINLMYLVLTALLALNVSSEILNSYRTINTSLDNSNQTIARKNKTLFQSLSEKLKDPKTRENAEKWAPLATQAHQLSETIFAEIEAIKLQLKKSSGYAPEKGKTEFKEAATKVPTKIMVDGKLGDTLFMQLLAYKNAMLQLHPDIKAEFQHTLPIDLSIPQVQNKSNNTWSSAYFRMTPTIAAITMLTKLQNDIRNAEAQVVEYCHKRIGQVQVVYDEFQAMAMTDAKYLFPGQEYTITAGIGAFSKNAKPIVSVDGVAVPLNANGVAEMKGVAGAPGTYTKKIQIAFTKPDGSIGRVQKEVVYVVGTPTGINISADAVKVLYIGLDNPVSIAGGSGKGAENIRASISQGSMVAQSAGKYIVRVTTPGKATITVHDGKTTKIEEFRVKQVPPPIAMVGNNVGGRMRATEFKAQHGVRAELRDFVFEGVKYTITGYTMTFAGAGFPEFTYKAVNGNSFAPVRDLIERARAGTTITIDEIKASGPGGMRHVNTISFNLY